MVGISLIGMGLMFSKMHPGSISEFDITEKDSMLDISLIGMGLMFSKMHPGSISEFDITEKD